MTPERNEPLFADLPGMSKSGKGGKLYNESIRELWPVVLPSYPTEFCADSSTRLKGNF
jgi:hypothetical protein